MMDEAQYIDYWGQANLKRWPEALVRSMKIPNESRHFLINVGLPDPDRTICQWELGWEELLPIYQYKRPVRLLATNYGEPHFLIDENLDGSIFRVFTSFSDNQQHERFANSSVEQLAFAMTAVDQLRDLRYDDPIYRIKVTELSRTLNDIDPVAMTDEDSMWPTDIFDRLIEC